MPAEELLTTGGLVLANSVLEYARRNPDKIATKLDRFLTALQKKKPRVLITGAKGAGKSVLCDYLTGEAQKEGYSPPDISLRAEDRDMPRQRGSRAFQLTAIPGERSLKRQKSLESLLDHKRDLVGVVHVVCTGLSRPRADLGEIGLGDQLPTLADLRKAGEEAELSDLNETLDKLRTYWQKHRKPFWLMVVAAKYDLYKTEGEERLRQIHPKGHDTPFVRALRGFQAKLGSDNVDLRFGIAAAWLEDLKWRNDTLPSHLADDHFTARERRDAYIKILRHQLYILAQG